MLWYKSWLETRWWFLVSLAILTVAAAGIPLSYPWVMKLAPNLDVVGGPLGEQIRKILDQMKDYRTYVWTQWWAKNLVEIWTVLAIRLGAGGLLAESARGRVLFTLALPVSRRAVFGVRCAVGVSEIVVLALIPSLIIRILSPSVDQTYPLSDVLIHCGLLLAAGLVFFSVTVLLSSVFVDQWKPILMTLGAAILIGLIWRLAPDSPPFSLVPVMIGNDYHFYGRIPWGGALTAIALSGAILYGALTLVERHDF
jgi:hypothetical protein